MNIDNQICVIWVCIEGSERVKVCVVCEVLYLWTSLCDTGIGTHGQGHTIIAGFHLGGAGGGGAFAPPPPLAGCLPPLEILLYIYCIVQHVALAPPGKQLFCPPLSKILNAALLLLLVLLLLVLVKGVGGLCGV